MTYRLKAELWVQSYIRQIASQNAYALVVRRGDKDAGGLYIRINGLQGSSGLLAANSDIDGQRYWRVCANADTPDAEIDAMLAREAQRDPDFWVIEVEDRAQRHFLIDPIEGTWHGAYS